MDSFLETGTRRLPVPPTVETRGDGELNPLKRQRDPLSDSEENVRSFIEPQDSPKRRCIGPGGDENLNPKRPWGKSPLRVRPRQVETEVKPDTPAICSIRSRLQQLTQRQTGGAVLRRGSVVAQRFLSDPGTEAAPGSSTCLEGEEGSKTELCLIGDAEFRSRVERFESRPAEAAPALTPRSRALSSLARTIQEKLRSVETPSKSRASRIRQEREAELRFLRSQPISDNAWLKRSWSDPSLAEVAVPSYSSSPQLVRRSRRLQWPPLRSWDQEEPCMQTEDAADGESNAGRPESNDCCVADKTAHSSFHPMESRSQLSGAGQHEEIEFPAGKEPSGVESPPSEQQEKAEYPLAVKMYEETDSSSEQTRQENMASPVGDGQENMASPVLEGEASLLCEGQEGEASLLCEGQEGEASLLCEGQEGEASPVLEGEEGEASPVLEGEASPVLEGEASLLCEGQEGEASPVLEGEASPVLEGEASPVLEGEASPVLEGEASPVLEGEASPVLEGEASPVLEGEASLLCEDQEGEASLLCEGQEGEASLLCEGQEGEASLLCEGQVFLLCEEQDGGLPESGRLKRVTFDLDPEMMESDPPEVDSQTSSMMDAETDSAQTTPGEMSTSQPLEAVLGTPEEEEGNGGSGGSVESEEGLEAGGVAENQALDSSVGDDLLSLPPSCILSPLSKSVEAVVTPMRLASSYLLDPPPLTLTPEELTTPSAESTPLYSIDAYRTQRQSSQPALPRVTPVGRSHVPETPRPQPPVNTKERIKLLSEEADRLQGVVTQTLQALGCCTDEGHGKGSLEEAEAEKLLLVSSEKRKALLAEVSRLRKSGEQDLDPDLASQQPCRGTVVIGNVRLPLKVEFVCSARTRTGRPTHYFFVLIRYGACHIVATPLATASDAQNGDTISFSTSITLQGIRSSFEVDVEVYSLSNTPGNNIGTERRSTKSKVTPKKLLNTITRSSHCVLSASLSSVGQQRSSSFALVGSHKITLASLGQRKFPLDKIKLDGKVRRLLGDEFQEKVPFLSPLEGNIYLQLDCEGHSNVHLSGFLTMFEDVSGFGAWHRRWFLLEGSVLSYWSYPNDERSKPPEGRISLASYSGQCVKPVKSDTCARPHTFELLSRRTLQEHSQYTQDKRWFSADTREERSEWMEKLSQALLDVFTWSRDPVTSAAQDCAPSCSRQPRESTL